MPLAPEGDAPVAATNGSEPKTMRERVELSAEALYTDIEDGLRAALTNATKARKTRCPSCQEAFEVRLPDHGASISAAKALLDLVVSRPRAETEPDLGEIAGDGVDIASLSTSQLRRSLHLTEESMVERLDEETAVLASMRHYDRPLAPIRTQRLEAVDVLGARRRER